MVKKYIIVFSMLAIFLLVNVSMVDASSRRYIYDHIMITVVDDYTDQYVKNYEISFNTTYENKDLPLPLESFNIETNRNPFFIVTILPHEIPLGTEFTIEVNSEDYKKVEPVKFVVTKDMPKWHTIFEHTFYLTPKKTPVKIILEHIPHIISINNTSYEIFTQTDKELKKIYYDEEYGGLILDIVGDSYVNNVINVTIQKEMMSGEFYVFDFESSTSFSTTENEHSTSVEINFGHGENRFGIKSTHVVPEFPTSQIIIVVGLIMIVILGFYFTKKKTNLQISEITSK